MNVLLFLLPLTGFSLILIVGAFLWAVRANQFDDLDSPAYRILYDEDIVPLEKEDEEKLDSKQISDTGEELKNSEEKES